MTETRGIAGDSHHQHRRDGGEQGAASAGPPALDGDAEARARDAALDRLYRRCAALPLAMTLLAAAAAVALRVDAALSGGAPDGAAMRICAVALMIGVPMLLLLRLNRRVIRAGAGGGRPR